MFSAEGYLARIGWQGRLEPTLDALIALTRAHMACIPFENLDVLLGRGVKVDLDSVYNKLVTARRGGYCYEHSTLFRAALEHAGFAHRIHAARVIMMTPRTASPRRISYCGF